jgi:hypothetical protein
MSYSIADYLAAYALVMSILLLSAYAMGWRPL